MPLEAEGEHLNTDPCTCDPYEEGDDPECEVHGGMLAEMDELRRLLQKHEQLAEPNRVKGIFLQTEVARER